MEDKILVIRLLCFAIFVLIGVCGMMIGYAFTTNRRYERELTYSERKTEIIMSLNKDIEEMEKRYEQFRDGLYHEYWHQPGVCDGLLDDTVGKSRAEMESKAQSQASKDSK